MSVFSLLRLLVFFSPSSFAAPASAPQELEPRIVNFNYAPAPASCPGTPLVRPAQGISADESSYYNARKSKTDAALAAWLGKHGKFSTAKQPSVAFAGSGGGYRALLESAGVIQALDGRDGNFGTSGLFQGLTYEAGLSGGAWFLSSFAGNNWPTISSLRDSLWEDAFENSLLLPANIVNSGEYVDVTADVVAKEVAGFDTTIVDPYGRLLSYQLLHGNDGGDAIRVSTITTYSNFTNHAVPYPIMTTTGVDRSYSGQCEPTLNATMYEFHPYEYGSWDNGISAFARTQYMGSNLTNGQPTQAGRCIEKYDNIGYVFGTSSDIFPGVCSVISPSTSSSADLDNVLEAIVSKAHAPAFDDLFGVYPNPFYKYPRSSKVNQHSLLTMADGGLSNQNVPIWPFIQPARNVDVLIASDNSADTSDNFPNGTEVHQTYLNAQAAGLTKMPFIPDVSTFVAKGLNKRATFFGCNSTNTVFIVYLPNVNYTFPSNEPTSKLQYSKAETDGMIKNGNQIATQNGDKNWPFCLACAVKHKDGSALPSGCNACFQKYCYRQSTTA